MSQLMILKNKNLIFIINLKNYLFINFFNYFKLNKNKKYIFFGCTLYFYYWSSIRALFWMYIFN